MYPIDAISIRLSITGTGSITLASSSRTIFDLAFQKQTTSKDLFLYCDSNIIASLYSSINTYNFPIQYICNGQLIFSTSGSGSTQSSLLITYVSRDISQTSNPVIGSTTPLYLNGFSYGDIITIMLLVFIFTLLFFKTLKEWILGTKVDGASAIKIEKYHNI